MATNKYDIRHSLLDLLIDDMNDNKYDVYFLSQVLDNAEQDWTNDNVQYLRGLIRDIVATITNCLDD